MRLIDVANTLPMQPKNIIERDNLLFTIERMFESDIQVIVIEGDPGMGKTTLAAQFVRRHPDNAFSTFILDNNSWGYEPLLEDLWNQLSYKSRGEVVHQDVDEGSLRQEAFRLRQRFRDQIFYFVVDGLDSIPADQRAIQQEIFSFIPKAGPNFRYLFTGNADRISRLFSKPPVLKSFPITTFSKDEISSFFPGFSRQEVLEIESLTKGIPGHLASVARLVSLEGPGDVSAFVKELPQKLPELFEMEWRAVNDDRDKMLLATLAHEERQFTVARLAEFLGIEEDDVNSALHRFSFLAVNEKSGVVNFVSGAFREFAASKLKELYDTVRDLAVEQLLKRPEDSEALTYLTQYLSGTGKDAELVNYLTPDILVLMLAQVKSLAPVKQQLSLGMKSSTALGQDPAIMRLGLQKSILNGFRGGEASKSEVRARVALESYEAAVAIANELSLSEDRLEILAAIGRAQKEINGAVERVLVDNIKQLLDETDVRGLGERASDIALDILYVSPELAIDLVERSYDVVRDENALDRALVALSIEALQAENRGTDIGGTVDRVQSRIKNPMATRLASEAAIHLRNSSAEEVIAETNKLTSEDAKIYLLRRWAVSHREQPESVSVIDRAFEIILTSPGYAPNAQVLKELAEPVPFLSNDKDITRLLKMFDSQKAAVEARGPVEEYVNLNLILATAQRKLNMDQATERILETFLYILDVPDLASRTAVFADFLAYVSVEDPDAILEAEYQIHSDARTELEKNLDELLAASAEHSIVTRGIMGALRTIDWELALRVAAALNTEARRDGAYQRLSMAAAEELDVDQALNALDRVIGDRLREDSLVEIFRKVASTANLDGAAQALFPRCMSWLSAMEDPYLKTKVHTHALKILLGESTRRDSLIAHVHRELNAAWNQIEEDWLRVESGYEVAAVLAPMAKEIGLEYCVFRSDLPRKSESPYHLNRKEVTTKIGNVLPR